MRLVVQFWEQLQADMSELMEKVTQPSAALVRVRSVVSSRAVTVHRIRRPKAPSW